MSVGTRNNSLKQLFVVLIVLLILAGLIGLYHMLRQQAYQKIQPYSLQLSVLAQQDTSILLEYDYGFGFHPAYQRRLSIVETEQTQTLSLSISAWKRVRSLRIRPAFSDALQLTSLNLKQADKAYHLDFQQLSDVLKQGELLLRNLDEKLLTSLPE